MPAARPAPFYLGDHTCSQSRGNLLTSTPSQPRSDVNGESVSRAVTNSHVLRVAWSQQMAGVGSCAMIVRDIASCTVLLPPHSALSTLCAGSDLVLLRLLRAFECTDHI
jgi:hypothetical protein